MKTIDSRKHALIVGWIWFGVGMLIVVLVGWVSFQTNQNIMTDDFLFKPFLIGLILVITGGLHFGISDIIKEGRKIKE